MKLELGDLTVDMSSAISRDGSCATCHQDPASPSSVGHVYLAADDRALPEASCDP